MAVCLHDNDCEIAQSTGRRVCTTLETELGVKEAEIARLVAQIARQDTCASGGSHELALRAVESDLAICKIPAVQKLASHLPFAAIILSPSPRAALGASRD